jgi:hypothetical protein
MASAPSLAAVRISLFPCTNVAAATSGLALAVKFFRKVAEYQMIEIYRLL